jgi:RNA polymerase sigma-70 factor (ECF subfamily)
LKTGISKLETSQYFIEIPMKKPGKKNNALDELALRARNGDRAALEALLADSNVKKIIYKKIADSGVHDPDDADDLYQDVRLKVSQKIHTWLGKSVITSWISRITIHTCIDFHRKSKHLVTITDLSPDKTASESLPSTSIEPEQTKIVAAAQLLDMMSDFFPELGERGEQFMKLFFFEQLEKKQIMQEVGLSRGFFNQIWKESCEALIKKIEELEQNHRKK